MKYRCNGCGEMFDENELTVAMSGCGMLCGCCYQIDARESYGDMMGYND